MAHTVRVDFVKNRVYLTLAGLMSDEEAAEAADKTIAAFRTLTAPFTCVTDISAFKPLTQKGVSQATRAGEIGRALGMRATVRVLGPSAVVAQQFQRASHTGGYSSHTARTVEEAEALLDGLPKI